MPGALEVRATGARGPAGDGGAGGAQGPILAFVYAVKEMLEGGEPSAAGPGGRLPCNVAFAIEGEEENGSSGFREARPLPATCPPPGP